MPQVEIYTRPFCGYCSRALQILKAKGADLHENRDAYGDPAEKRAMVERAGGASSFPQIFIGGRHVGGCDDLVALDRSGELDRLLTA